MVRDGATSVDLDIQPKKLRARWLDDIDVCSVNRLYTARGRLAIWHDLIRNIFKRPVSSIFRIFFRIFSCFQTIFRVKLFFLGEKLKGRLLKGSFGKACALTCRLLCRSLPHPPTLPTPFPFSLIFHNNHPPLLTPPNPSPRDTNRNSHPFAKTTPGKNYPLVCARFLGASEGNSTVGAKKLRREGLCG